MLIVRPEECLKRLLTQCEQMDIPGIKHLSLENLNEEYNLVVDAIFGKL
jgi:NAD(P)H-hydrate repair Nnr-like enzyme with NAD(P)H-hydrate epimerase domain